MARPFLLLYLSASQTIVVRFDRHRGRVLPASIIQNRVFLALLPVHGSEQCAICSVNTMQLPAKTAQRAIRADRKGSKVLQRTDSQALAGYMYWAIADLGRGAASLAEGTVLTQNQVWMK